MFPTQKCAIADTLENLSKSNYEAFVEQLLDRRESPRVRRVSVEDKPPLKVTNVLVSTFTESKVLQVVVDTLREINCNEEAERLSEAGTLYSIAKACVDNGDPTLPKKPTGELETNPSQEALKISADQWPSRNAGNRNPPPKTASEVEAEAKARVLSEGGDPSNRRLILSRFMIQFGKYQGQRFKWLLENDVAYAVYVVATHQKEREHNKDQNPWMANKDSLTQYAIAYADVLKGVRLYWIKNGPTKKQTPSTRGHPYTRDTGPVQRTSSRTRKWR